MSLVIGRSCLKVKNNGLFPRHLLFVSRSYNDDKFTNNTDPEFTNSSILIESGFHVQELPVVVRRLKNIIEVDDNCPVPTSQMTTNESINFHLIQTEFQQCGDLKDVFSLLSKCTKITPNIALGAMEKICDLEKSSSSMTIDSKTIHVNLAKGAILDKLLQVVMKTDETQTILNVLNSVSSFMVPYKYKFSNELLVRVLDNKLSIEQLCEFVTFLSINRSNSTYSDTIDKLWVGFIEKENYINENNILQVFNILPMLKTSKKTIQMLVEQKFSDLWYKIEVPHMKDILNIFIEEKYFSVQSFAVVGRWLNTNIHMLDEDSLLDIVSKLTQLKYTDDQVEKAVEKYIKLKGSKIKNDVLIVGILNFCKQFHLRNDEILNACSEYFLMKGKSIPICFLKSVIYTYGFLSFNPVRSSEFWSHTEEILYENFDKMKTDDLCSIVLGHIYNEKYPLKIVEMMFSPEYLVKITNPVIMKQLHLIDTALSLECKEYSGPLLPKDQCSKPIDQDKRVKNIVGKIMNTLEAAAGGPNQLCIGVLVPNLLSDETYFVDVMIHPPGLGTNHLNWKSKSGRTENIALLIHLPDHYCSDNDHLIGSQIMKIRHLKLLGMTVVSLKYTVLSQLYSSFNVSAIRNYILDCISNAK